jgi:hypothetical protein
MPNLFLSGVMTSSIYAQRTLEHTPNQLLSMHGNYLNIARHWFREFPKVRNTKEVEVLLDSGAFTAWSKKEPDIDVYQLLRNYSAVFKRLRDNYKEIWFINLDKIPGSVDAPPTREEIANAIHVSDKNYKILSAELGFNVLPVFHRTESIERLHEVIELNPHYICAATRTEGAEIHRREWSQRVMLLLGDKKVHGLAATGSLMIQGVPWHSIDSSTFAQAAGFGHVIVPHIKGFTRIPVSVQSPTRRHFGKHLDTITGPVKDRALQICEALKLTYEELRTKQPARWLFNVYSLREVAAKGFTETPIQTTLFEL